ncbi:MAG TPA: replication-associated recombination protein A [Patescibacteria group bacterium]|nr:replication-associated recombination protein A [Patescibacteria group bacterium]
MQQPLAERLRPTKIEEFVGQEHLLGEGRPIRRMLENKQVTSMILWGPPGVGKTTLASLISRYIDADFIFFSAVTSGVADVRKVIEKASQLRKTNNQQTVLFVDEIHRFNKAQQDAFLPSVEDGTIILIGATTENPGFRVNAPLISRSQVYVLNSLTDEDLEKIVKRAIKELGKSLPAGRQVKWSKDAIEHIIKQANGDARTALNAVELAASISNNVDIKTAEEAVQQKAIFYDKKGDWHYDTISAFIKSMRGSQPDATLHYLARMIKSGEDPMFIARRMVIFASEDIGNAQPTAMVLATACMQAVHMIGMPEAQLILAQTATYLATAKKSIASTMGIGAAMSDIDEEHLDPIPLHLRNAANKVMKKLDYGKGHIRYTWKVEKETGQKVEQEYMPKNLKGKKYYKEDWK